MGAMTSYIPSGVKNTMLREVIRQLETTHPTFNYDLKKGEVSIGAWLLKGPDFLMLPAAAFFEYEDLIFKEEGETKSADYLRKLGYSMAVPYKNIPNDDLKLGLDFVKAIMPRSGLGAMEKCDIASDRKSITIEMADTFEARFNTAKKRQRKCYCMEGYLQFIGEHFLGWGSAKCEEIECRATGGKKCVFVVTKETG